MEQNLLDKMLSSYAEAKIPVTIVLQNRARVSGRIKAFDNYVVVLENRKSEIVYRHAISSLARQTSAPLSAKQNAEVKTIQAKPQKPTVQQHKHKPAKSAPRVAASPESGINTGMKEGLMRWMQERKVEK